MKYEQICCDIGFDSKLQRYYCLFMIVLNGDMFYASTGCSKFDSTGNMNDFTIEFLDVTGYNQIDIAYNKVMFEDLEQETYTELETAFDKTKIG